MSVLNFFVLPKEHLWKDFFFKILKGRHFLLSDGKNENIIFGLFLDTLVQFIRKLDSLLWSK